MHCGNNTRRRASIVAACFMATLMSSCSNSTKDTAQRVTASPVTNNSLAGTSWVAETILGNAADVADSTVSFSENNTLGGSTGCNNYTGPVTVELSDIAVGLLATTRRMCEPAISGQETAFLEALELSKRWQITDSVLTLMDQNDEQVMTLVARMTEPDSK